MIEVFLIILVKHRVNRIDFSYRDLPTFDLIEDHFAECRQGRTIDLTLWIP